MQIGMKHTAVANDSQSSNVSCRVIARQWFGTFNVKKQPVPGWKTPQTLTKSVACSAPGSPAKVYEGGGRSGSPLCREVNMHCSLGNFPVSVQSRHTPSLGTSVKSYSILFRRGSYNPNQRTSFRSLSGELSPNRRRVIPTTKDHVSQHPPSVRQIHM
jgi:hypothetical protein